MAITQQVADFHDRDLYAFVYDMNGVNVAHGANPALIGENRINLSDEGGKFFIQELVAVAKGPWTWMGGLLLAKSGLS